ncbi:MAG: radical SAM protein [Candidatus Omnitrophota bacterium]
MVLSRKRKAKLFKLLGIVELPVLPYILNIEPGNICNLHCPLCPTGSGDKSLSKGLMNLGVFKVIFDQLFYSIESMNIYSWGEPFLNKELVDIIRYAKKKSSKVRIATSTNLNVRNNELLADFIGSGIDEVIISCDGIDQSSYARYRRGGDFGLVIANMKYLADINEKRELQSKLVWNFIVFKHNETMVDQARKMAEEIGVEFRVGLMRTSMKDEILKPHKEAIAKDKEWIPDNPDYSAYDKEGLATKKPIKTCRKPWQEISINWDGKVFPCCAVYGDDFNFGDVTKDSIVKIWNNEKYIEARKEIINRRRKAATICGICRNNGFMHM